MIDENISAKVRTFLLLATGVIVAVCLYFIISSIITSLNTGVLKVSANEPSAIINISQANHQIQRIGQGQASVRLQPGKYTVFASNGNQQANATVTVSKRGTTQANLRLVSVPKLRSVDNVSFNGFNKLIDMGLTTDQMAILKLDLFHFDTAARNVTINSSNIYREPHNPNVDTSFAIDFNVTIDRQAYKARASYAGLEDIRLYMYDATTGNLLFDSYTNTAKG